MSDCLQKRIGISQPTYCLDETGEPIESTVMYNWMHVRAVGPNCLKDTTLCGTTNIHHPCLDEQVFGMALTINSYLDNYQGPTGSIGYTINPHVRNWYYWIGPAAAPGLGQFPDPIQATPLDFDQWYPVGYGIVQQDDPFVRNWGTHYCYSNDTQFSNECMVETYGVTYPLIIGGQRTFIPLTGTPNFAEGTPSLRNTSGKTLSLRVKLSGRVNMDWSSFAPNTPVGGDMNWTICVGDVADTTIPMYPLLGEPILGSTFALNLGVDTINPAVTSPYDGTFSTTFFYELETSHTLVPYFLCSAFIDTPANPIADILISPTFSNIMLDAKIVGIDGSTTFDCFPDPPPIQPT